MKNLQQLANFANITHFPLKLPQRDIVQPLSCKYSNDAARRSLHKY